MVLEKQAVKDEEQFGVVNAVDRGEGLEEVVGDFLEEGELLHAPQYIHFLRMLRRLTAKRKRQKPEREKDTKPCGTRS